MIVVRCESGVDWVMVYLDFCGECLGVGLMVRHFCGMDRFCGVVCLTWYGVACILDERYFWISARLR